MESSVKKSNRNGRTRSNNFTNNCGISSSQDFGVRNSHFLRRERAQNLRHRTVNMKNYEQMIGYAKDNFADIIQGEGNECTICCKINDIFGLSLCRHPVCMECAIRMRILSNSNLCPVCRANMETLWFVFVSSDLERVSLSFKSSKHPDEERFGIRFQNKDVCTRYDKYLAHVCRLCKSVDGERLEFPTFVALRHHMSNVHQLSYCHICTENITLFSRERKAYTRDALQRHILYGDSDDKSLKGHPSCLFCDQRFFDEECRYRHLRKEHFFCQFCESEGKHLNVFFENHSDLMCHYKNKHFVCDVEECRVMGIVFSNQIDLNLHKSKEHSGRRAAVALDFHYNDRQLAGPSRTRRELPSDQTAPVIRRDKISIVQQEKISQPRRTPDEFIVVPSAQSKNHAVHRNVAPAYTPENKDFPALGNSSSPLLTYSGSFPPSSKGNRKGQSSSQSASAVEDFPALCAAPGRSSVASVWSAKNNPKSIIVGCKMPNKNMTSQHNITQPDIWPKKCNTPPGEVGMEQWHQVPTKSRKSDKKKRSPQPKAEQSDTSGLPNAEQQSPMEESREPLTIPPSKIEKNGSSNGVVGSVKFELENDETECILGRSETKLMTKDVNSELMKRSVSMLENDAAAHSRPSSGEELAEDSSKNLDSSETAVQSSSISDLLKPYASSIFSNLSLANILGKRQPRNSVSPPVVPARAVHNNDSPPQELAAAIQKCSSTYFDTSLRPAATPSLDEDILLGPPPGFEDICAVDSVPPGLLISASCTSSLPVVPSMAHSGQKHD